MAKAAAAPAPMQKKADAPRTSAGAGGGHRQEMPRMDSLSGWQHSMGNQHLLNLLSSRRIQLKSRSASADPLEAEADRASELVTLRIQPPQIQPRCTGGDSCHCENCSQENRQSRLQLSNSSNQVQRQTKQESSAGEAAAKEAAGARKPAGGFLVEDDATSLSKGQMQKSVFLGQVQDVVCVTANAELSAAGRSADKCPYIASWLAHYRGQSAFHIERALWKYAPEAVSASSAKEYFGIIRRRVRQAVATWAKTGQVTGLPPGVPMRPPAGGAPPGAKEEKSKPETQEKEGFGTSLLRTLTGEKRVQFKERPGRSPNAADPETVRSQLGSGKNLDSRSRTRMESAFGQDFSRVRIHTDSRAEDLSSQLSARAFTLGSDIAFASGEYRPGTLVGDALLAHELAHVVQQDGGNAQKKGSPLSGIAQHAFESDANLSAAKAMTSLWAGATARLAGVKERAAPTLRSGVQLQRCGCKAAKDPKIPAGDVARACFEENNTQLSKSEQTKIESAIAAVAGDNSALSERFYNYFSHHDVIKASSSDMSKWGKSQLAETKPSSDTYLKPSVFDPSYPAAEVGALLLHEFSHTRHEENVMGLADFQEGDSYAIEYFFSERKGIKKRQVEILNIFAKPTSIAMASLVPALREHFNTTYGTLQGLYEVIDKGASSHPKSPFTTPALLTKDEAKNLAAELVASTPGNRSPRLNDILDWVKKNPSAFSSPI